MPSLPLQLGNTVLGGNLPVTTQADVNAALPLFLQPDDPAAVRDAITLALTQILLRYQQRAAFAAEQSDILSATGACLTQAAADLGTFRQNGEQDTPLRARAILSPSLVTPTAILAAVNALLAPYTSILPRYQESLSDRWFLRLLTSTSFLSPRGYLYKRASIPQSPDDLSRLYPSEAAYNGGLSCPQREPGAARLFGDMVGRYFMIRIPDLSSLNSAVQPVYQGVPSSAEILSESQFGLYIGTGTSATNTSYIRANPTSTTVLYGSIINTVNRIKGAGVRWLLLADPKLVS